MQQKVQRRAGLGVRGGSARSAGSAGFSAPVSNPFESIGVRLKNPVMGKRVKGADKQRDTASRGDALRKRRLALLEEMDSVNTQNNNSFVDRRFGQYDATMTDEERALVRFQKQREHKNKSGASVRQKKKKKKNVFNLDDDDDDDDGEEDEEQELLEAGGHGVMGLAPGLGRPMHEDGLGMDSGMEDEDADGDVDMDTLTHDGMPVAAGASSASSSAFASARGGLFRQPAGAGGTKTKQDVMREVMLKDKFYRMERQREHHEQEEFVEDLDATWHSIEAKVRKGEAALETKASPPPPPSSSSAALATRTKKRKQPESGADEEEEHEEQEEGQGEEGEEDGEGDGQAAAAAHTMKPRQGGGRDHGAHDDGDDGDDGDDDDEDMDDFDVLVRKLATDERAKAEDRLLDPEEMAAITKARLFQLEQERMQRMQSRVASDGGASGDGGGYEHAVGNSAEALSGDALGGNFELDPEFAMADSDEDIDYDAEDIVLQDTAPATDGLTAKQAKKAKQQKRREQLIEKRRLGAAGLAMKALSGGTTPATSAAAAAAAASPSASACASGADSHMSEVPFMFEAPRTHKHLLEVVDAYDSRHLGVILERMIACNHPSISSENLSKMQRFFAVLVHHVKYVCDECPYDEHTVAKLDALTVSLFELCTAMPREAARVSREALHSMRQGFLHRAGEHAGDASGASASVLPSVGEIMFVQLLTRLYPSSDYRHNVMVPALHLLSECLVHSPLASPRDVAKALLMCNVILTFVKLSRRIVPELLIFLQQLLESGVEKADDTTAARKTLGTVVVNKKPLPVTFSSQMSRLWAGLSFREEQQGGDHGRRKGKERSGSTGADTKAACVTLPLSCLMQPDAADEYFASAQFRRSALVVALNLIEESAQTYAIVPSFPEMFVPIADALERVQEPTGASMPKYVGKHIAHVLEHLRAHSRDMVQSRLPLIQRHRPQALKLYNPQFEENFNPTKDLDVDERRAELKKMKRAAKKEEKTAMRELRRDAAILATEQQKRLLREKEEYSNTVNKTMTALRVTQENANLWDQISKKKRAAQKKKRG